MLAGRFAFRLRPGLRGLSGEIPLAVVASLIGTKTSPGDHSRLPVRSPRRQALGDIMGRLWNHDSREPWHNAILHRRQTTVREKLRMVSAESVPRIQRKVRKRRMVEGTAPCPNVLCSWTGRTDGNGIPTPTVSSIWTWHKPNRPVRRQTQGRARYRGGIATRVDPSLRWHV